jgi:hypothetical protein
MDCSICCEKMNKTTRKSISCRYCEKTACMACTRTYLLNTHNIPHCMHCRKEWPKNFLSRTFPSTFLKKDLRQKRETVLFEQEKTFLPELQPYGEIQRKFNEVRDEMKGVRTLMIENEMNEEQLVRVQKETRLRLRAEMSKYMENERLLYRQQARIQRAPVKKLFLMPCPLDCRGFLDEHYKCGLCTKKICKLCHIEKSEEKEDEKHECEPGLVATVSELNRSSKPCPKCHIRISKTDGCDQMFCIQCKTAFSWNTGEIARGVIHNPHYFELLRQGSLNVPEERGGCNRLPGFTVVQNLLRQSGTDPAFILQIEHVYRMCLHHRDVTLRIEIHNPDEIRSERIKYLSGEWDEKKFKQKVFVRDQHQQRYTEESALAQTYLSIGEDLFSRMTIHNTKDTIIQLLTLRRITQEGWNDINGNYQHKGITQLTEW